jgi:hypothetical protein
MSHVPCRMPHIPYNMPCPLSYVADLAAALDDLPFKPSHLWKLGKRIQGIMLVDHNMPLSYWKDTPVLGMVDQ